jgi:hypothetical protein
MERFSETLRQVNADSAALQKQHERTSEKIISAIRQSSQLKRAAEEPIIHDKIRDAVVTKAYAAAARFNSTPGRLLAQVGTAVTAIGLGVAGINSEPK